MRRLFAGLRALIARRRVERDLDDELHAYLQAEIDANVRAGAPHDEAVRRARVLVGSVEATKDAVRDVGWESHVDSLWRDLRFALRGMRRSPGFASVAVLMLALGIGANSAIFTIVNALVLRVLPVASPERLVIVSTRSSIQQGFPAGWNYAIWSQIRQQRDLFEDAVAWTALPQLLDLSTGGERQPADGTFVSGNFFQELGVAMAAGRAFSPADDVLGSIDSRVAVISYGFWQRRFGGAADAIGKTLLVNRVAVTIVGVAPASFLGPEVGRAFDIALPIGSAPAIRGEPEWGGPAGRSYLAVMLRLRPGQSADAVAGALRARQRQIVAAAMPPKSYWGEVQDNEMNDPFAITPAAAGTSELRRQYSRSLLTLQMIAALVLLIACANLANLLLARAAARRHELSVRVALGAPTRRIVRQQLVESLALAGAGAVAGLLLATWASRVLATHLSTWFDRVRLDVSPDWRVLAFTAGVSACTAMIFGTLPAIRASRVPPAAAMKDVRSDASRDRVLHMRGGLMALQIAVSLVLVVTAALLIRSFNQLGAVPLGFDPNPVLVASVDTRRVPEAEAQGTLLLDRVAAAARAVPGVERAAVSLNTPFNHGVTAVADFTAPSGAALPPPQQRAIVNLVTPGWFETYGMRLVAGRPIDQRDAAGAPPSVVVNEAFARTFFPRGNALGARIVNRFSDPDRPQPSPIIVGIVANAADQSLRADAYPTVYEPMAQFSFPIRLGDFTLSLRTRTGSPAALSRSVAAALGSIHPDLAFSFQLVADQVDAARHQERLVAWLSGLFGALAVVLAAIGLYGVTSYAVVRRRGEIGIRVALGAQRRDVVALTVRQTVLMMVLGVIGGLMAAAVATRYLQALLFGITPLDPLAFAAAAAVLVLIALLACYVPARRAASIDPLETLRCQ